MRASGGPDMKPAWRHSTRVALALVALTWCATASLSTHRSGRQGAPRTASPTSRASGSTSTARRSRHRWPRSLPHRGRPQRPASAPRRSSPITTHKVSERRPVDGRRPAGWTRAGDEVGGGQARLRSRAHPRRARSTRRRGCAASRAAIRPACSPPATTTPTRSSRFRATWCSCSR